MEEVNALFSEDERLYPEGEYPEQSCSLEQIKAHPKFAQALRIAQKMDLIWVDGKPLLEGDETPETFFDDPDGFHWASAAFDMFAQHPALFQREELSQQIQALARKIIQKKSGERELVIRESAEQAKEDFLPDLGFSLSPISFKNEVDRRDERVLEQPPFKIDRAKLKGQPVHEKLMEIGQSHDLSPQGYALLMKDVIHAMRVNHVQLPQDLIPPQNVWYYEALAGSKELYLADSDPEGRLARLMYELLPIDFGVSLGGTRKTLGVTRGARKIQFAHLLKIPSRMDSVQETAQYYYKMSEDDERIEEQGFVDSFTPLEGDGER